MHFQQAGQQNDSTAETEMQAEPLSQTSTALEAAAQHTPTPLDPNPPACPMENSEEPAPASTSKGECSRREGFKAKTCPLSEHKMNFRFFGHIRGSNTLPDVSIHISLDMFWLSTQTVYCSITSRDELLHFSVCHDHRIQFIFVTCWMWPLLFIPCLVGRIVVKTSRRGWSLRPCDTRWWQEPVLRRRVPRLTARRRAGCQGGQVSTWHTHTCQQQCEWVRRTF